MAFNQRETHNHDPAALGHLLARPSSPGTTIFTPGLHQLALDSARDGFYYIPPASYQPHMPAPLLVMLHGAGSTAQNGLAPLLPLSDSYGLLLLAPDSRQRTWDAILDGYGPDVRFLDQALTKLFQHYTVDATHLAIAGFSDGASYALSLGLSNPGLFTHILAFSPGFIPAQHDDGPLSKPRIYLSHGKFDTVLSIDRCSRRIVPRLQHEGYEVLYHEFNGIHTLPRPIAREALTWFLSNNDNQ